jgi:hypothetical protein
MAASENSFGKGLVHELTGSATRDNVSAFNLENLLFGTIGHLALGVFAATVFMKATGKEGPKFISGVINPILKVDEKIRGAANAVAAAV